MAPSNENVFIFIIPFDFYCRPHFTQYGIEVLRLSDLPNNSYSDKASP